MSGLVYLHVETAADALVVVDASRRTYMALSRDGRRYHLIQPLEIGSPLVGDGLRSAGQLGCSCAGGTFRGRCYRVQEAEQFEAGRAPEPSEAEVRHERLTEGEATWFDSPAGAGESVEAFRG